jgi:hypothetical protein
MMLDPEVVMDTTSTLEAAALMLVIKPILQE